MHPRDRGVERTGEGVGTGPAGAVRMRVRTRLAEKQGRAAGPAKSGQGKRTPHTFVQKSKDDFRCYVLGDVKHRLAMPECIHRAQRRTG